MASYKKGDRVWFSLDHFKTMYPATIDEDHNGHDYLVKFIIDGQKIAHYVGSYDIKPMNALDRLADV